MQTNTPSGKNSIFSAIGDIQKMFCSDEGTYRLQELLSSKGFCKYRRGFKWAAGDCLSVVGVAGNENRWQ